MVGAVIAMLVVLGVAVGITLVVAVGIAGKASDRAPRVSTRLQRAARHLNGEADAPPRLEKLVREVVERVESDRVPSATTAAPQAEHATR
ncbi:hypothetical protein [Desertihabitans aurantiacus]|uniref:hypothetical protein n=1 Tax=Desertihabitans aurantiacus TaxID=2282477 RepID=UPI000DF82BA7|nr:hypothetical protein [Desertihabitans aurantiacus]